MTTIVRHEHVQITGLMASPDARNACAAGCLRVGSARLALLLLACLGGMGSLGAADILNRPPPDSATAVLDHDSAMRLVELGRRAMNDSNTTPARSVDAALAFVSALHFFATSGDQDMISELNANIFWCKKRMNLDDLRGFLAAKGGDANDAKLIAEAAALVEQQVQASEAQAYFDRANAYAQEHPTAYAQITSRYFEVAERFPNTELSAKAQRLSLDAQKQLLELTKAAQEILRATIFTRVIAASAPGREAVPVADDLRTAVTTIRKQYKDDYAKRRPSQKRRLSRLLAKDAADRNQSAAMRYALYDEAGGLALEAKDYLGLLNLGDDMAGNFALDATQKKLAWLGKERGNTVAIAITKLLATPLDADANTLVGKELCFTERYWDEGVRLLALGNDPVLKNVADMEVLKPEGSAQQVELADRWDKLATKASGPMKEQMVARSVHWFGKAQPGLKGFTRDRVAKRLVELGELLPYTLFNYAIDLTVKQWERIPFKAIEVPATNERQDTGLVLTRGMRVRIVPHPTETWSFNYGSYTWNHSVTKAPMANIFDTNCWGRDVLKADNERCIFPDEEHYPNIIGALVMCIDKGQVNLAGLLKGEEQAARVKYDNISSEGSLTGLGRVFIGPHLPGNGKGSGKLRVKICILHEE